MKPLSSEPLVSVAVPTYNRAAILAEAIRSLQAQTYQNLEILVVDDASTDETEVVMRDLAAREPRLKYLRHEKNQRANAARNTALNAATGELVALLDSDDRLRREKIARQVEALKRAPDAIGSVCQVQLFEKTPGDTEFVWNTFHGDKPLRRFCRNDPVWAPEAGLWRMEAFRQILPLPPERRFHQDVEIHLRLLLLSEDVILLPDVLADHNDASAPRISNARYADRAATIAAVFRGVEVELRRQGRLGGPLAEALASTAIHTAIVAAYNREPKIAFDRFAAALRLQSDNGKKMGLAFVYPALAAALITTGRGGEVAERLLRPFGAEGHRWWRRFTVAGERAGVAKRPLHSEPV